MPGIISQAMTPDGIIITTSGFGTIQLTVSVQGNTAHIDITQDAKNIGQVNISQATAQKVEDWGRAQLAIYLKSAVYVDWHIFSLTPFSCLLASSVSPLPNNWWEGD